MKKNIDLVIDGIAPEKVMYDTDNHSLIVLYPAQEEFKKGDILSSLNYEYAMCIYKDKSPTRIGNISTYLGIDSDGKLLPEISNSWGAEATYRHATEEEKQTLFNALAKEGKKWNKETLEVEDIKPEFKKGDILASDDALLIFDEYATYNKEKDMLHSLWNNIRTTYNKNWVTKYFTYATDEQKAQVHEDLRKDGKRWNAETLQVEDIKKEFKRGDIVIHDNTKRISVFDKLRNDNLRFDAIFGLSRFNDVHDYCSWNTRTLRHATPQEIEQFDNDLKSIGKKWNKETLEVEDLDISEIVIDLVSACEYLEIKRPSFFILDACERSEKFEAQITLQLICEAWNKFDGFEVDYANSEQDKYFPVLDVYGDIKCLVSLSTTHISASCYSFPTQERAIQFGKQFKELFREAMGL